MNRPAAAVLGLVALAALAAAVLLSLGGGRSSRSPPATAERAPAPAAADRPAGAVPAGPPPAPEVGALTTAPVRRALATGAGHRWRLDLEAGDFAHVVVEQLGADVTVAVLDPAGAPRLTIDTPTFTGTEGDERLYLHAERGGTYRLEVRAIDDRGPASGYRARLAARRPATADDRRRARSEELFQRGAAAHRVAGDGAAAAPLLAEAARGFAALGDEPRRADAEHERCLALSGGGLLDEALAACRSALAVYDRLGPDWRRAAVRHLVGRLYAGQDDPGQAIEWFERALPLKRAQGDRWSLAVLLDELGRAHRELRSYHQALTAFDEAIANFRALGDTAEEATALHSRGHAYLELGRPRQAAADFQSALALAGRSDGDRAATLTALGVAWIEAGEPEAAVVHIEEALAIATRIGDGGGTALALTSLGLARAAGGRPQEAARLYRRALPLAEAAGERKLVGHIHHNLAWLAADERPQEAIRLFDRALAAYRRVGDRQAEVRTLLGLARAERARGRLAAALQHLELGLLIVGDLRDRLDRHDLRVAYMARRYDLYDFAVELLMDLDRVFPGQGWDARALEMSESARSRGLLDLLNELGIDPRRGGDPELLERERRLQGRQYAAAARLRRLQEAGGTPPERLAAAERALQEAADELRNLGAEIRRRSPAVAALAAPEVLDAAAIQGRLLDPDAVLLEYKLGAERSFLWAVGAGGLESFELAGREELAALARGLHDRVGRPPRRAAARAVDRSLAELSRALVCPARGWLDRRRLIVVPEGDLLYVPFAALSLAHCDGAAGAARAAPLAAGHEIVTVPSASALAALRGRPRRPPPAQTLAVLADPVFDLCDPRVPPAVRRGGCPPAPPRLRHSAEEAAAILALAPPAERIAALGFDARRRAVLDGLAGGARYLHFATHIETRAHPARVVLSRVDRRGGTVDHSDLFAGEIADLRLAADLVVLSGCDSGLGEEVRGEGLVGLTQGFFRAGAGGVLASLWPVDDRATASLMATFYRVLLHEDLTPAAALARAQQEVARQPRWRAPYFWAGFVLLGEGEPGGGGGRVARLAR